MRFKKFNKLYNINPLEYLRLLYGEVYYDDLENIIAMEELIEDSKRMAEDLNKQKKEFFEKMKRQGKDFNRL